MHSYIYGYAWHKLLQAEGVRDSDLVQRGVLACALACLLHSYPELASCVDLRALSLPNESWQNGKGLYHHCHSAGGAVPAVVQHETYCEIYFEEKKWD